jgi:Zn-dependent protease
MKNLRQGSVHLFRVAGIDLYLHWSWFLIAAYEIGTGGLGSYSSRSWNVLEYLALFAIVTLHEFGHALACRSVGGNAKQIVLWPLGGVAYVDPPPRPGAMLWSIAAGPLVNVALIPVLWTLGALSQSHGWAQTMPNAYAWLRAVAEINSGLLIFNILPIYPLDGGQILRSLLWFGMGRGRSLMVATIVGFVGVFAFAAVAVWTQSVWFIALAVFMLMNCWSGLQQSRALLRLAKLPRRLGFSCPRCQAAPPIGSFWICGQCQQPFDMFEAQAACPNCAARYATIACLDCGGLNPLSGWQAAPLPLQN